MYKLLKTASGTTPVPIDSALFDSRKIFLTGEITQETANEVFRNILMLNADSTKPITMIINSGGGEIAAGLSIYDTMKLSAAPIKTVNISEAYSMAAILFSCGTGGRYMFPNAKLMLHEPLLKTPVGGNVSDIRSLYETINASKDMINNILAKNCNKTLSEIDALTTKYDHFFDATESIKHGFADGIITDLTSIIKGE